MAWSAQARAAALEARRMNRRFVNVKQRFNRGTIKVLARGSSVKEMNTRARQAAITRNTRRNLRLQAAGYVKAGRASEAPSLKSRNAQARYTGYFGARSRR